ncbi:RNase HII [Andreprevotia lacus DSM 23236]|jgi:ribonuclease HII|uniref:Ribonuclease HII n=1 Tax=Andreprevotia lacus DSM 23236 TaxID=1121001 RepID=A0A1W1XLL9_9NEIS|nr:ribonuclease HII [Andreprevotia lacus]SMC24785.1 RNase HII [Andreprevotia lacus DSM 23236]
MALICGVDEAGRGPLVGSVFAAAVILPDDHGIVGLADSKKLTAQKREQLAVLIRERAIAWAVCGVDAQEIDRINILQATMLAMQRAVEALAVQPELAQVDGNRAPKVAMAVETIIKGDAKVQAISAASILAKVARDAEADELEARYPGYGFAQHKGYGTAMHLAALKALGPCPAHRMSFAPVRAAASQSTLW